MKEQKYTNYKDNSNSCNQSDVEYLYFEKGQLPLILGPIHQSCSHMMSFMLSSRVISTPYNIND